MNNTILPSHKVNVLKLANLGTVIKLHAEKKDFPALISHMSLTGMDAFSAQLTFKPWARDGVQVAGELTAELATPCPITLEPVPQSIRANFDAKFAPSSSKLAKPRLNEEGEMILDALSDDIPDIYEGESLDAWAIAIEYLLLEIDPFARADGAEFETGSTPQIPPEGKLSPFAALQSLKK